jgi:uncharacterized protein YacL
MSDALIFIFLLVGIICSFITGVFLLYRYRKTKSKKLLWFGLILTFIIPGLLILLLIWWIVSSVTTTCYSPIAPVNGNVSVLIGLPLFVKQRDKFINKFKNQVSQDVFNKITKKNK